MSLDKNIWENTNYKWTWIWIWICFTNNLFQVVANGSKIGWGGMWFIWEEIWSNIPWVNSYWNQISLDWSFKYWWCSKQRIKLKKKNNFLHTLHHRPPTLSRQKKSLDKWLDRLSIYWKEKKRNCWSIFFSIWKAKQFWNCISKLVKYIFEEKQVRTNE